MRKTLISSFVALAIVAMLCLTYGRQLKWIQERYSIKGVTLGCSRSSVSTILSNEFRVPSSDPDAFVEYCSKKVPPGEEIDKDCVFVGFKNDHATHVIGSQLIVDGKELSAGCAIDSVQRVIGNDGKHVPDDGYGHPVICFEITDTFGYPILSVIVNYDQGRVSRFQLYRPGTYQGS